MPEMILKGHKVTKGKTKGEALVSHSPISFFGGVSSETGVIVEKGHELEGESISDKIFVFPYGKGSTAGSYILYELAYCKKGPKAIISNRADPIVAIGAIIGNIPMVDKLVPNPLEAIKTGDQVEVDADRGIVKVRPGSS